MTDDRNPILALARAAIAFAAGSALCLAALHVLSPEFAPSWRMVSEYALGEHGAVLRGFFFAWGASSLAVAGAVAATTSGPRARIGAALVLLSGLGAIAGGLFDVRHPLHGLAFGLGVPTLPLGALLLLSARSARAPARRGWLRLTTLATWLSVVGMGGAMGMFIQALQEAGAFHPGAVLDALPPGVPAVIGVANRLLVAVFLAWNVVAALALSRGSNRRP